VPDSSAFNIPESPVAALGTLTLLAAFLVAAFAAAAGILGNAHERRRLVTSSVYGLYVFFALSLFASALIVYAFVTHDYTIKYVAHYSDTSMPLSYKITAFWGGLDGSLLFWVFVLSAFSAVAVRVNHHRHKDMIGYVVGVIMVVQLFFLALLIYNKNPFATFLVTPPMEGKGLNPLLQNYWMVIHPPSLYIGFVAATIPFAFGIAALASGRLDDQWLGSVRSWMLICWFFLSFGLILGGRWAYEELGWGGYWAWDPVENAGFLPWFTATAFLHTIIIQEQRQMMKVWNLVLVIVTFFLTIFGTFMTRSGIVQSVHAFGQDNDLALLFVLFMLFVLATSFGLLIYRLPRLSSTNRFESYLSREFAFLLNNWILLGCAFFVLFSTMWPTLKEFFVGQRITLGPDHFNRWMAPIGLVLLFLAGAAPLLAYRKTSRNRVKAQFTIPLVVTVAAVSAIALLFPETRVLSPLFGGAKLHLKLPLTLVCFGLSAFTIASVVQEYVVGTRVRCKQTGSSPLTAFIGLTVAKRRKYGGYIVHLGIALMFIGFAGKSLEAMEDFTVSKVGETFKMRGYTFRYDDLIITDDDHKKAVTAPVTLFWGAEELDKLRPARWQYQKQPDQPTTEVDMHHHLEEDVYIILTGFDPDTKVANFRVYINPLINWVWIGFVFLALGCAVCLVSPHITDRAAPAAAAVVFIVALCGGAGSAAAQGAEYSQGSAHQAGASVAHLFRPNSPELLDKYRDWAAKEVARKHPGLAANTPTHAQAMAETLAPISGVAEKLMRDLVCLCGGCQRETLYECRCGFAGEERKEVLELLASYDLTTPAGRDQAYRGVVAAFVRKYEAKRKGDGERVLMIPPDSALNRLSWLVPAAAIAGGLVLIFALSRRWIKKGAAVAKPAPAKEDDVYAERLDDELHQTE
jgi:cytochrome c-type biogenesis protein CcmF